MRLRIAWRQVFGLVPQSSQPGTTVTMTSDVLIPNLDDIRIAVIGLGYVGLPLAVEFGKTRSVIGFDINNGRIETLKTGHDVTLEVSREELLGATQLSFESDANALQGCNVFIITVPTPVDKGNRPDLTHLLTASESVGTVLKPGDIVIYESTVYPGATEEDCVPALERVSGLTFNQDFFAGYSPERINPGDKKHRLPDILKVTSGSTPEIADLIDRLYGSIITAGTYKAESIRIAEAAKVIENTQRDINIALVNELAIIFNRMGLDTEAVLKAAGTKWNFLPFRPGLVGGHCIDVDPYYLTHKAQELGYHPEVILAGRRLNDNMGGYIAGQMIKGMLKKGIPVSGARILVMGLTFKENCPDLRNTGVVDVISELKDYGLTVDVWDPWADPSLAVEEYGIELTETPEDGVYDGLTVAVAHDVFREMGSKTVRKLGKVEHLLYDVKALYPRDESDIRL